MRSHILKLITLFSSIRKIRGDSTTRITGSPPIGSLSSFEHHQPIRLDHIKVWVNFFEKQTEAHIQFDRQIYSKMISISSLQGNQGQTGSGHADC